MSTPSRQVHVRLPAESARCLDLLQERFGGLPPSSVLRFLMSHMLDELTIDEQVEIVTRQIMKKPSHQAPRKHKSGMNTTSRLT